MILQILRQVCLSEKDIKFQAGILIILDEINFELIKPSFIIKKV